MNLFSTINIIAVLGTTCLMMAVSTIWYSSLLFGKFVWKTEDEEYNDSYALRLTLLRFVAYACVLSLLSSMISLSPLLSLKPSAIAVALLVLAGALISLPAILERRPLSYYLTNVGFVGVLIVGGTFVLQYWPW